jgi:hypothetical protein
MIELGGTKAHPEWARVYWGNLHITREFLATYCYLGKDSAGRPALRFKPTNKQRAEILQQMEVMGSMPITEYWSEIEPYTTHISELSGDVVEDNRGVVFEHWFVATQCNEQWHYNTRAHIYGADVKDWEVKTCYNSTFMKWGTLVGLIGQDLVNSL